MQLATNDIKQIGTLINYGGSNIQCFNCNLSASFKAAHHQNKANLHKNDKYLYSI